MKNTQHSLPTRTAASRPFVYGILLFSVVFGIAAGCGDTATDTGAGGSNTTDTSSGAGGAGGAGGAVEPTSGSGGASAECVIASDCGAITECVSYACIADACQVTFTPKGTVCGNANADTLCDGSGTCVLKYCFDGKLSGSETDVDCGGPFCKPCVNGRSCNDSSDCTNGVCETEATSRENAGKVCKPCTLNDHCADGRWCNQGACVLVEEAGVTCSSAAECATGHCADGVCCNTACDGACDACSKASGAEQDGTCRIKGVENAADPGRCDDTHGTCGGACRCDAKGACILAQGETCTKDVDCATGHCADGVCCNTACDAACSACSKKKSPDVLEDGTCTAFAIKNADDAGRCDQTHGDCGGACSCNAEGACDSGLGETCTLDKDCVSGHCADGVCCNTECTGNCNTCVKSLGAEKDGTCKKVVNAGITGSCDATHGGCDGGACTCNAESACTLVNPAKGLAAGGYHTCALLTDSSVKCWGFNAYGQLGIKNTTDQNAPGSTVDLGNGATQIAAGTYHTCALLTDGSVKCWGYNSFGQLGIKNTTNQNAPGSAVNLGNGATATQIVGGGYHTCALLTDGSVKCWGYNLQGQLGINSTTDQNTPGSFVNFGDGVTAKGLAAGSSHTCALLTDGSVKCWGYNAQGQLGIGSTTQQPAPGSAVKLGKLATQIAAGTYHTCALLTDGSTKCWGYNASGELGINSTTQQNAPGIAVNLGNGATAKGLAAGSKYTCALLTDGSAKCWGYNAYGQLGIGSTTQQNAPGSAVNLGNGATAKELAAGLSHACALLTGGSVKCWGFNSFGQLGINNTKTQGTSASHMGDNLPFVLLTP